MRTLATENVRRDKRAALVAGALCLLQAGTTSAFVVHEDEAKRMQLSGWAQAGYELDAEESGRITDHGLYLGMARLSGQIELFELGYGLVQFEGNTGSVQLLDLVAELRPAPAVAVRAGYYRTPTSADMHVAGPYTPFVNRSLLVTEGFVYGRLAGGEILAQHDLEIGRLSARAGLFGLPSAPSGGLPSGLASLQAQLDTRLGLTLHAAYLDHLEQVEPVGAPRPRLDQQLDLALVYRNQGWTMTLEAVAALGGGVAGPPAALYIQALKSFELPWKDLALEPGVRYDVTRHPDRSLQRLTSGMTLYVAGDELNASLNHELLTGEGPWKSTVYLQLQAGF